MPRAVFSDCRRYRYFLEWPTEHQNDNALLFIGANPSKAGQLDDNGDMKSDPTISRMRNLAQDMGFGLLWAVNARSWVSTDPLHVPSDPMAIGPKTDNWIRSSCRQAKLVLCAYGLLAETRAARVLELVREAGKVPHALALTKEGVPRHPRGVPKWARPFPLPEWAPGGTP